jgi:hypothetical protein
MFADIFLVKDGASPDPSNPLFSWESIHHYRHCTTIIHGCGIALMDCVFSVDQVFTQSKGPEGEKLVRGLCRCQ